MTLPALPPQCATSSHNCHCPNTQEQGYGQTVLAGNTTDKLPNLLGCLGKTCDVATISRGKYPKHDPKANNAGCSDLDGKCTVIHKHSRCGAEVAPDTALLLVTTVGELVLRA